MESKNQDVLTVTKDDMINEMEGGREFVGDWIMNGIKIISDVIIQCRLLEKEGRVKPDPETISAYVHVLRDLRTLYDMNKEYEKIIDESMLIA